MTTVLAIASLAALMIQAARAAWRAHASGSRAVGLLAPLIPASQALGVAIGLAAMSGTTGMEPHRWALALGGLLCVATDPLLLRMEADAADAAAVEAYARALEEQLPAQRVHLANARTASRRMDEVRDAVLAAYDDAIARLEADEDPCVQNPSGPRGAAVDLIAPRCCAHPALDALLAVKRAQLAEVDIELVLTCDAPRQLDVPAPELCAIAGNLIDNAARAVEGLPGADDRRVEFRIGIAQGHLAVRIENPLVPDAELPTARPTRRIGPDLPEHGWGTSIVDELARRRGGAFTLKRADGKAVAAVIIPLRDKN